MVTAQLLQTPTHTQQDHLDERHVSHEAVGVAYFQMEGQSWGYFFRFSSSACMVVFSPAEVVRRHDDRRLCRAMRITEEDSCHEGKEIVVTRWNLHFKHFY